MAELNVLPPNLNVLPPNWREKATLCLEAQADELKKRGKERVWVDDDCPLQLSIMVTDEHRRVFRIIDPAYTLLMLRALRWPDVLVKLYSQQYLPEISRIKRSLKTCDYN